MINNKASFCLRLFNDFERIEDANNIDYIPTINKFNVENAEVNIYLTASGGPFLGKNYKDIKSASFKSAIKHPKWKYTKYSKTGEDALRETETFDTFFESSWYFARFCSPNSKDIIEKKESKYLNLLSS